MSERTAPSLARLDELIPLLKALPKTADHQLLVEDAEALRRAVAAFHMEAIRFRMHSVDRRMQATEVPPAASQAFDQLRQALESAGFHTRSHSAP